MNQLTPKGPGHGLSLVGIAFKGQGPSKAPDRMTPAAHWHRAITVQRGRWDRYRQHSFVDAVIDTHIDTPESRALRERRILAALGRRPAILLINRFIIVFNRGARAAARNSAAARPHLRRGARRPRAAIKDDDEAIDEEDCRVVIPDELGSAASRGRGPPPERGRALAALAVPEARAPGPLAGAGVDVEGDEDGAGRGEEEGEERRAAEEAHPRGARGEVAAAAQPDKGAGEAEEEDEERAAHTLARLARNVARGASAPTVISAVWGRSVHEDSLVVYDFWGLTCDIFLTVFPNILRRSKFAWNMNVHSLAHIHFCREMR